MTYLAIILGLLVIALTLVSTYLFAKRPKKNQDPETLLVLQQQINQLSEQLNRSLVDSTQSINKQFQEQFRTTSEIVRNVTERLTKLDETNKQVVGFAEQLQSLENILKNPKHRGILGEYYLETLLGNVFQPNQYQLQYPFKNGDKVDAALFVGEKIVPIDAKFSLEKFNQMSGKNDKVRREVIEREFKNDIKKRIDETAKYIRPEEKTVEFAFMFIPAEGIYSSILVYKTGTAGINTHDLLEYAHKKRVIIVSPSSFFAYLQTVIQGLKSMKVEEGILEIVGKIRDLDRHLQGYGTYFGKLGNSLSTTVNMYNSASKELNKIDKDIYKITDGESGGGSKIELLNRPQEEE